VAPPHARHRILRLYPRAWQRRYGPELDAILDERPPTLGARIDLLAGAFDAHLHPLEPPRWPAVAAGAGGVVWTSVAAFAAGQPVPPDWPGYLLDTLPLQTAAVPVLAIAAIGASMRLGPADPRGLGIGRLLVIAGSAIWVVLLIRAMTDGWSGPELALAATAMAAGCILLGQVLLRGGDWPVSGLLMLAGLCLLIPGVWAGVAYGVTWTAAAAAQIRAPAPAAPPSMPRSS
jgi:hypothetical protein